MKWTWLDRRGFNRLLFGSSVAAASFGSRSAAAAQEVRVFKNPQCGCCNGWVSHLEANGFTASVQDMEDLSGVKRLGGVPEELGSCHTAIVDGYTRGRPRAGPRSAAPARRARRPSATTCSRSPRADAPAAS